MKIAISTQGENLGGSVDPRFGRCMNFLIVNTDDMSFKVLKNEAQFEAHGAGLRAAQIIINQGVSGIISGTVGPNAFGVLKSANVSMYTFNGPIIEAINLLKNNSLSILTVPSRGHKGMGGGRGMQNRLR